MLFDRGMRPVGIITGEPGIVETTRVHIFVAQVAAAEDLQVDHG